MRFRNFSLVLGLAIVGVAGCTTAPKPTTAQRPPKSSSKPFDPSGKLAGNDSANKADSNDGSLLLGNPTNAGKDADNYLLARPQYTMSYNRSRGGANWVAWHIDAQDLGDSGRSDNFRPDPDLPADWQITPNDYRGSGYDRGHVCPSGDRTNSRADNNVTFYMSNMLPQTAELNRAVWADFENELRDIVRQNNEIYVIAGGTGQSGTIAGGKVVVPKVCWKIALILPAGQNDLKRINAQTRVIAVAMPNVAEQKLKDSKWSDYLVTVQKLGDATKLNFFSTLPPNVQKALKAKKDSGS